jgi:hypothetical protein
MQVSLARGLPQPPVTVPLGGELVYANYSLLPGYTEYCY